LFCDKEISSFLQPFLSETPKENNQLMQSSQSENHGLLQVVFSSQPKQKKASKVSLSSLFGMLTSTIFSTAAIEQPRISSSNSEPCGSSPVLIAST